MFLESGSKVFPLSWPLGPLSPFVNVHNSCSTWPHSAYVQNSVLFSTATRPSILDGGWCVAGHGAVFCHLNMFCNVNSGFLISCDYINLLCI